MSLRRSAKRKRQLLSFIIPFIALFLAFATLTLLLLGVKLAKSPIGTSTYEQLPAKARFTHEASIQASELYEKAYPNEYLACLVGTMNGNEMVVQSLNQVVTNASESHVVFQSNDCPFGFIHSHPSGICALSKEDLYAWGASHTKITAVQCSKDRISVFGINEEGRVGMLQ